MSYPKAPLRCRWGLHDWSIYTEPIHVRWCYRCSKRDPEGRTAFEVLYAAMQNEGLL